MLHFNKRLGFHKNPPVYLQWVNLIIPHGLPRRKIKNVLEVKSIPFELWAKWHKPRTLAVATMMLKRMICFQFEENQLAFGWYPRNYTTCLWLIVPRTKWKISWTKISMISIFAKVQIYINSFQDFAN